MPKPNMTNMVDEEVLKKDCSSLEKKTIRNDINTLNHNAFLYTKEIKFLKTLPSNKTENFAVTN